MKKINNNNTPALENYRNDHALVTHTLRTGGNNDYVVSWDTDAKVTHVGSLVYFAQFLNESGLFEQMLQNTPLRYTSHNAPQERDIFGTIVLSILNGQTRYEHISTLRNDHVAADIFGMSKIMSEDSIRRALARGKYSDWDSWLKKQERAVYETLLSEPYILDIDNTVKTLYGNQEGAQVGYNPKKPGRPSHNYHTYFMSELRIIFGVDVLPGTQSAGKYSMPNLWSMLDSLSKKYRPKYLRGDIGYGNDAIMTEAEKRGQLYLFKLRQSPGVQAQIEKLERAHSTWNDAGDGWHGIETNIALMGWTQSRRCIILRRKIKNQTAVVSSEKELAFIEPIAGGSVYEYSALVTNAPLSIVEAAQLYRDRADCENVFDEIKNQWGWAGYVTNDLQRCRIIARLVALVYNWWNIFTRLAKPTQHMEATTSRPQLLHAVGRLVKTGRRTILRLTPTHAHAESIRATLESIGVFLNRLSRTAEQLSKEKKWALILSLAFVKWLRGKVLQPAYESGQYLLGV
jgi:hypothetical protein